MGADSGFDGREVEARRAVDAITIEERHGRHGICGTGADELFGQGSAVEKAEGGTGVEFNIFQLERPWLRSSHPWERRFLSIVNSFREPAIGVDVIVDAV